MLSSLKMKAGRWFRNARGKFPNCFRRTKGKSSQRKMKSLPRSLFFVCVLHPNGQGQRNPVFKVHLLGPPQDFGCVAPGRDSISLVGSRAVVASGASSSAFGVGSSFVGPALLEQPQSPDGSFLVSRGTSLRRCPPVFGSRSTDGFLRGRDRKAGSSKDDVFGLNMVRARRGCVELLANSSKDHVSGLLVRDTARLSERYGRTVSLRASATVGACGCR